MGAATSLFKNITPQAKVAPYQSTSIPELQALATKYAQENARSSVALEREIDPQLAALRENIYGGLLNQIQGGGLSGRIEAEGNRILDLGGSIPLEVRNIIARNAISSSTRNTGGQLTGLGRDVVARDLGLNSMDLYNQRLQQAQGIAQYSDASRFNIANLINSTQRPSVGLAPESLANVSIANTNALNAYNQFKSSTDFNNKALISRMIMP